MPLRRRSFWLLSVLGACALLAALLCVAPATPEEPAGPPEEPRLAVLVVFDQMRGDFPKRWQALFGKKGFGRLQRDGAWFENCHYPYAYTLTAAGHASMSTGCAPRKHGIIANSWYDRASGDEIEAVRTDRFQAVPTPAPSKTPILGAAPVRRRQPSVGEALTLGPDPKGKVVSLSIKDRAAVLLAALRASLCSWFSTYTGTFVSSTYYGDRLPAWVVEDNRQHPADQWFGKDWTRFRPDLDYARYSGPDDVAAEGTGVNQGNTFPHPITGGLDKITRAYYEAMIDSPFGNELLLGLAKRAIDAEKLGQRGARDLLCLSFSSNDLIGHTWGPDSQEVLDVTLRSDQIVADLLDYLDAKVGKGRYLFVVCADHGVCPLPEVAKAEGKDAGRVPPEVLTSRAEAFLNDTFNKDKDKLPFIEAVSGLMIYLNHGTLREQKLDQTKVEQSLAAWLIKQEGVQSAYTRTQLSGGRPKNDPIAEMVWQSFDADSSGDISVVLKPYHILSPAIGPGKLTTYRAMHGSPHPYDTHVPLLVYGPGVRPGVRQERVTPLAVAPILAHGLGVRPPAGADVAVPNGLFRQEGRR